ncbi:MAG TPA: menaquinone biosynthesis decarboxylase [Armatimonadota bacterium]|nr:menaquinone biosynthesis decarboxylase [Armatimonadota bacterium]
MAFTGLNDYLYQLEQRGELRRVSTEIDPYLEITELADRVVKSGGPALLIEHPKGADFPLAIGLYGTMARTEFALGAKLDAIADRLRQWVQTEPPVTMIDKLKQLPRLAQFAGFLPKVVSSAPCQQVVMDEPDLHRLPVMTCWPLDGGPFFTLPMVFTKDPETGRRNCGMYRLQVFDKQTTGMHWQCHKTGARHYAIHEARGERMPVAVAVGGDPAITYAATAPLPDGIDEMIFAGFIRQCPVEMVTCKTCDLEVPADADFIIEGYVDPHERHREGPFGDHTGYYSLADDYPIFHVTCITHRRNAIYPSTIVGRPPMEDGFLGKATERIFLPLTKMMVPGIVDMNLPIAGAFHNLAIVSIRKQYPGHARTIMNAIWGLGQMANTKTILVVDEEVNVHDIDEVIWRVGNHIDPERDTQFTLGPVDVLDHASRLPAYGSKMGIDATKKWPGEGFTREWPDEIRMSSDVQARIDKLMTELHIG